ncbi:replication-relaxation family protein [Rhodococcus sp. BP-332]|nr:replication-relaxation family protein [Rhodococcus sp. BP-332]
MNQSEYPHRADSVGEPASITVQEGGAVGVATASTQPAPSSPVRPQSNAPREQTDAATPGSIQPAGGPTQRGHTRRQNLAGIADALSDRDWAILRSVEAHRFLTTAQITRLHFADHAEASGPALTRRVLGRLRGRRLLTTLERRIGGVRAGSSGLVFCVDVVGDRLLRRDTNRPSRRRFSEPSTSFLRHTLTVAETHVSLVEADRAAKCQLVRCDIEPA